MRDTIFDSYSEKLIFSRLKTYWSKYVDVFPQIPVRNVVGYEEIISFSQNQKVEAYLLKTSFDFVVCELDTGAPILAVEFDGLSGGFSKEGSFHIKSVQKKDPYRKLKMETKLRLCEEYQVPMVAVSYDETNLLPESYDWITVLDVIIGDAIEKKAFENYQDKYMEMLIKAYKMGGRSSAELKSIEIGIINERHNPIKKKINKITQKFPYWPMQIIFPKEEGEWVSGQFFLNYGVKAQNASIFTKKLIKVDLKIRKVGIFNSDNLFLFNTIGEYCLARKTELEIGSDRKKWQELIKNTQWSN